MFDANKMVKISEDFHVDLNSPFLRQMVPPPSGLTDSGPHPLSEKATRALVVSLLTHTVLTLRAHYFQEKICIQQISS